MPMRKLLLGIVTAAVFAVGAASAQTAAPTPQTSKIPRLRARLALIARPNQRHRVLPPRPIASRRERRDWLHSAAEKQPEHTCSRDRPVDLKKDRRLQRRGAKGFELAKGYALMVIYAGLARDALSWSSGRQSVLVPARSGQCTRARLTEAGIRNPHAPISQGTGSNTSTAAS